MEDNVPFFDMMSDPVPLLAQETRFGACASSLKAKESRYCNTHI